MKLFLVFFAILLASKNSENLQDGKTGDIALYNPPQKCKASPNYQVPSYLKSSDIMKTHHLEIFDNIWMSRKSWTKKIVRWSRRVLKIKSLLWIRSKLEANEEIVAIYVRKAAEFQNKPSGFWANALSNSSQHQTILRKDWLNLPVVET